MEAEFKNQCIERVIEGDEDFEEIFGPGSYVLTKNHIVRVITPQYLIRFELPSHYTTWHLVAGILQGEYVKCTEKMYKILVS